MRIMPSVTMICPNVAPALIELRSRRANCTLDAVVGSPGVIGAQHGQLQKLSPIHDAFLRRQLAQRGVDILLSRECGEGRDKPYTKQQACYPGSHQHLLLFVL
jgi:hypothetical protein